MNDKPHWLLLVISLPTRPAAARMRLWRALKALGCAALRDGAYLMPDVPAAAALERLAREAAAAGGSAEVLGVEAADEAQEERLRGLFDRSADYGRLLAAMADTRPDEKAVRALRRRYAAIAVTDFFDGEARRQAETALAALEAAVAGEPVAVAGGVRRYDRQEYRGRTWATRKRLWVDRMASAWLIRRFIDREASFVWLDDPKRCPKRALGFDFDGAAFTHTGSLVTFEVLAASFGLDTDPAVVRIGAIVHSLDVGGVPVAEGAGVEAVLAGLRAAAGDDDKLLREASRIFDGLYRHYREESTHDPDD